MANTELSSSNEQFIFLNPTLLEKLVPKASKLYSLDRIALGLTLSGVILGIVVAMVGRIVDQNFVMHGYGVFVAFSVSAIVLGIVTRSSPLGKTAAITSAILLVGSVALLG